MEATLFDKALLVGAAYLVGSIPFGLFIAGLRGVDIQAVGSGNIGATNVARNLGVPLAVLTGVCDLAKGTLPVLAARILMDSAVGISLVAFAAVLGHCASIFLDFRGGKGVATSAGVLLVVMPLPTLGAAIAWGGMMALTKISSVSALVALPVLLILMLVFRPSDLQWLPLFLALGGLVVWRHRENLAKLRKGSELALGSEKRAAASEQKEGEARG